ncbi:MAG: single-stranded-DNA-specific exonuclease RecJ [Chloroflexota bacterium]
MSHSRWKLLPPCPDHLLRQAQVPSLLAQLLFNRGVTDPREYDAFLSADRRLAHDPFLLPDMPQAVSRIYRALLSGDKVVIFGDFDVDGITAALLLVEGLELLGGSVTPYLPHRVDEGHGLNVPALEEFKRAGVSLVITADCGVTSLVEVERARELGLDVVVTDHHVLLPQLPRACAVVNPKRADSTYPYRHLAGVGVAFKLLEALSIGTGRPVAGEDVLDLVALGTIADMSPLTGENRCLVKTGLEVLNRAPRPGIAALVEYSGLRQGMVTSDSVSWALAPRINAAGRVEHAHLAFRLLRTTSAEEAERLASRLDEVNKERQSLVEAHWRQAREHVLASQFERPILVVCDPGYPPGVCGLIANRLVDEFRRPAAVLHVGEVNTKGSCRSIPAFDMVAALSECSDLFIQFGGHPGAAGFTLPTEKVETLAQRLLELAEERLAGVDLRPEITVDAEVEPSVLVGETLQMLQCLEPFGQGNPPPMFLARSLEVLEARVVGNGGQHLKLKLRKGGVVWPAIGFDLGSHHSDIAPRLDILYNPQVNRWGNRETLELSVVDFQPSPS